MSEYTRRPDTPVGSPDRRRRLAWSAYGPCPTCGTSAGQACVDEDWLRERRAPQYQNDAHPTRPLGSTAAVTDPSWIGES